MRGADGGFGRRGDGLLGGARRVVVDWVCDERGGFTCGSADEFGEWCDAVGGVGGGVVG